MAWIRVIKETDAEGELARLYEKLTAGWGGVDNILKIHSLSPESLEKHFQLYAVLMKGSPGLPREKREMIAVTVSALNDCFY